MPLFSLNYTILGNIVIIFMLECKVVIVTLKLINNYFKFSVLISKMVNIHGYKQHKQIFWDFQQF